MSVLPVWPPTPCRQSIEWIHTDSPPSSPIPRSFCDGLTLLPAAVSVTLAQTPEPGCVAYYPRETAPPHGTSTHGVPGLHKRVQLFVSVPVSQMPAEKFLGREISPSTHTGKCVHWSPRPLAYTLDAGSYGSSRGVRATPRVSRLKGSLRAGAVSHAGTLRASRHTATHVTQPYTALQGLVNRCRGRTGRFTLASATRRARARRGWVAAVRTHLSLPSIQIGLSPCSCLQCTHREVGERSETRSPSALLAPPVGRHRRTRCGVRAQPDDKWPSMGFGGPERVSKPAVKGHTSLPQN